MHNLDITDGIASFVSDNGEDAWHRLGQTIDKKGLTAAEALSFAHLDQWNVRKYPLKVQLPDGTLLDMPGRAGVVRDNPIRKGQIDVIGDVGKDYGIIQNEEHVALLDALVHESGAHFATAGALDDNGRRVFVTMRMPGHIKVGGQDRVDNYIAAVNSHDSSTAFSLMVTPVRIVCANTLNMAFRNHSHIFKIRHTSNATKGVVIAAQQALELTFEYLEDFEQQAQELINKTVTQAQFEELIAANFGAPEDAAKAVQTRAEKRLDEMTELFANANTQAGIRGTAWAALNALTEWSDHYAPVRGDDPEGQRARKALLDPGFKNRALALVQAL